MRSLGAAYESELIEDSGYSPMTHQDKQILKFSGITAAIALGIGFIVGRNVAKKKK